MKSNGDYGIISTEYRPFQEEPHFNWDWEIQRVRPLKFTMCWRGIGLDSFDQAWELICQYCKTHISEVAYNTWLERLKPVSLDFERGVAIIEAPNKFHMSTVHSFYSKLLQDAFDNVFGGGSLVPDLPARRGAPARPPARAGGRGGLRVELRHLCGGTQIGRAHV